MAESVNVFKNQIIMKLNLSDITTQGCIRDCHLLASPKVGFKHIFYGFILEGSTPRLCLHIVNWAASYQLGFLTS